jgi:hypothetical protein
MLLARAVVGILAASIGQGQAQPAPVLEFGGRASVGERVYVLDRGSGLPRVWEIDPSTLRRTARTLRPGSREITTYGLVVEPGGDVRVLADKGRRMLRFRSGAEGADEDQLLASPSSGIWRLGTRVILNPIQLGGDDRLLVELAGTQLRRFGSLTPRQGNSLETRLVGNMMRCASESGGELPCWHLAGGGEVLFLREDGRMRRVPVTGMAGPARTPKNPGNPEEVILSWLYPIRDVQLLPGGDFWVLTNQEGPIPPSEPGSIRGRHALLIRGRDGSTLRAITLLREAKALLHATPAELVLLFADGSIERVSAGEGQDSRQ